MLLMRCVRADLVTTATIAHHQIGSIASKFTLTLFIVRLIGIRDAHSHYLNHSIYLIGKNAVKDVDNM